MAFIFSNHIILPLPFWRFYSLPNRPENLNRRSVKLSNMRVTLLHETPQCRGSSVETPHLMLLAYFPEGAHVRVSRDAFEHDDIGAQTEGSVHDVTVAGDPADVGGAVVDVVALKVEGQLGGERGPDHLAAGAVEHALRLARRA